MGKARHAVQILTLSLPYRNTSFTRYDQQFLNSWPGTFFIDK
jgi:hypothetical protein